MKLDRFIGRAFMLAPLLVLGILLLTIASAQQPTIVPHPAPPPTPEAQALAQKLMSEINANIQCTAAGISIQQRLNAAEAEIKTLKDKYEPAKSDIKPPQPKAPE